jgi:hypothetical protein
VSPALEFTYSNVQNSCGSRIDVFKLTDGLFYPGIFGFPDRITMHYNIAARHENDSWLKLDMKNDVNNGDIVTLRE